MGPPDEVSHCSHNRTAMAAALQKVAVLFAALVLSPWLGTQIRQDGAHQRAGRCPQKYVQRREAWQAAGLDTTQQQGGYQVSAGHDEERCVSLPCSEELDSEDTDI